MSSSARALAIARPRAACGCAIRLERLRALGSPRGGGLGRLAGEPFNILYDTRCGTRIARRWRIWRNSSAHRMARLWRRRATCGTNAIVLWVGQETEGEWGQLPRPHGMEAHAQSSGSGAGQAPFLSALRGLSRFWRLLPCIRQSADYLFGIANPAGKTHPGLSVQVGNCRAVSGACAASRSFILGTRIGANTIATNN